MTNYKNCRTIEKAEVKTTYRISFSMDTLKDIISDFADAKKNNSAEMYITNDAFKNVIISSDKEINNTLSYGLFEQSTVDEIVGYFKLNPCGFHGDTFNYIARKLGFDGYSCAGYYNENTEKYEMEVYNKGDRLN